VRKAKKSRPSWKQIAQLLFEGWQTTRAGRFAAGATHVIAEKEGT
jgi:hypothetical protein